MAITPVRVPDFQPGHPNFAYTDFDRAGDSVLRFDGRPVEIYRFTGDGSTTTKTVQTAFDNVIGGMVFNMTDGANASGFPIDITVTRNSTDPTQADVAGIPADTDVYMLVLWGDKTVAEPTYEVNSLAPSAPELSAVVDSATQVTLTRGTSSHPSQAIAGYEYQKDSGSWTAFGSGTTKAVTGLTTATAYTFKVRAYVDDAYGNRTYSAASNTVSVTTS